MIQSGANEMKKQKLKKYILLMLVGLVIILCSQHLKYITPTVVRDFLVKFGPLAPIVYIVLFTFVPLTLFPDAVLAIAAGLVFGIVPGAVYTMIGAASGGTLAFLITRNIGHEAVLKKLESHSKISHMIEEKGFLIVLIMRLIPLIPFDVISYAAGATNIKYKDYMLATLLGIIPGVTILVTMGDGLASPDQPKLYMAICAFIVLLVLAKKGHKRLFSEKGIQVSDEV